jgi:cobalt-zinc-cadmium efflux system outer membrane protein
LTRTFGVGALALLCSASAAAQTPSALSLSDAIARASQANRTILAARSGRAVDIAGVDVARQRPNPELAVEEDKETPHWAVGATVPIETSGKRGRRIAVANATVAATDADIANTTAGVRADVRRAYYQAVAAERRVAIAQELQTIATRARDAAQERFQTGAAPQLEALQASLALSQAQNEVAMAEGERTAARAELNALLAYPLDATPVLSDSLDAGPLPTLADANQQALNASAELQALQKQIDLARAKVELAKALRRPDPAITSTLTYDAPGEFTYGYRFGVAIALPILTTGRPEIAVAEATLTRAVADRDARVAEITGSVSSALARATAARQSVQRFTNEILPSSLQVEQMAQESYSSGQTGLPALLQALQTARDVRQQALQAGLEYQLALADLERAMGTPLR